MCQQRLSRDLDRTSGSALSLPYSLADASLLFTSHTTTTTAIIHHASKSVSEHILHCNPFAYACPCYSDWEKCASHSLHLRLINS